MEARLQLMSAYLDVTKPKTTSVFISTRLHSARLGSRVSRYCEARSAISGSSFSFSFSTAAHLDHHHVGSSHFRYLIICSKK